MIASSAKRPNQKGLVTEPLRGVSKDLKMFKRKFKDTNMHYIETSRDLDILLTRRYITNWLLQRFQQSTKDVYLFYTGHGN